MAGFDPSRGGRLGVTPILWRFKMQYPWSGQLAIEEPDWDQCCTCWEFGVSEGEARTKVWAKFKPPAGIPESIKECLPERYQTERDIALATATGTAKTAKPVECEASQSGPEGATPNPLKDRDHD